MNLISCDECGVVLDKNKLKFPTSKYMDDGTIDHSKSTWRNGEYLLFVKCPVCMAEILDENP